MTVWERGETRTLAAQMADLKEALADLRWHYVRALTMILTGRDPQKAGKP
jgi:hypothetical protein